MPSMFLNKVVLVTGASSGIGAATTALLALQGAHLVITGRNEANLNQVAEKCYEETWNRPKTVLGDLTDEEDVRRIFHSTLTFYGRIDVLINNAGILEQGTIENTSLDQLDRMMKTNVRSMYQLTMLAVPHLISSRGNIVNVSSVNGIRPVSLIFSSTDGVGCKPTNLKEEGIFKELFTNVLAYNMSKAAVNQFTQCVAMELASKLVRVNAVNPGVIITELQKRGGMTTDIYRKFIRRCQETHPLGRPGFAQEVAEAIAFLASDKASFITGVTLPVDGGRHALSPR